MELPAPGHPLVDQLHRVLVVSDTHFFHTRLVLELAPGIRPLNVDTLMLERWRESVRADDLVLHLGDVIVGGGLPEQYNDRLPHLPGRVFLLPGNHDRSPHKLEAYLGRGWSLIRPFQMVYRDTLIHVTHEPIPEEELLPGEVNVHGHIHHHLKGDGYVNCSVEHLDYRPTPVTDLLDRAIEKR